MDRVKPLDEMTFAEMVEALAALDGAGDLGLEEVMLRAKIDRRVMSVLSSYAPGDERRATVRVPASLPIRLLMGEREIAAMLVDLGEGGVRVRVAEPLDAVEMIEVELADAERAPARARARVSWRRDGAEGLDLGLQFVSEPTGHRRRMRHMVLVILSRLHPRAPDA